MRSATLTRSLLTLFMVLTFSAISLNAQSDYSHNRSTRMLTLGLQVAFGASMGTQAPTGSKIGPIFAYRITGEATYPLTPVIATSLGFGLDSRGSNIHA